MTSARMIICACGCGQQGYHGAHSWIAACYKRWLRAGQPQGGPPVGSRRASAVQGGRVIALRAAARREDYAWLRETQRLSIARAADRLGVCRRTAERYEADLKARAA